MVDYLYDGTFEGLLTCVYHHYYTEKAAGIYTSDQYQSTMLAHHHTVETEEKKAAIVYRAIEKKISAYDLRRVYKVYLSNIDQKETKILHYLRLGFKKGSCVSMLHGDPAVAAVQEVERKVNFETHRLKGLIRFSELTNGVMYSPIEPDHDVLQFLAGHFCDRFKNQPFIIHDVKRNKALVAHQRQWYVTAFTAEQLPDFDQEERGYQNLWKQYFESIAIKQRINSRCQKNMMPVRYWQHLTELQTSITLPGNT